MFIGDIKIDYLGEILTFYAEVNLGTKLLPGHPIFQNHNGIQIKRRNKNLVPFGNENFYKCLKPSHYPCQFISECRMQ